MNRTTGNRSVPTLSVHTLYFTLCIVASLTAAPDLAAQEGRYIFFFDRIFANEEIDGQLVHDWTMLENPTREDKVVPGLHSLLIEEWYVVPGYRRGVFAGDPFFDWHFNVRKTPTSAHDTVTVDEYFLSDDGPYPGEKVMRVAGSVPVEYPAVFIFPPFDIPGAGTRQFEGWGAVHQVGAIRHMDVTVQNRGAPVDLELTLLDQDQNAVSVRYPIPGRDQSGTWMTHRYNFPLYRILSSRGIDLAQYLVFDSIQIVSRELDALLNEELDYYYSLDDRAEEQYREAYQAGTHPFYANTATLDLLIRDIVIVADG